MIVEGYIKLYRSLTKWEWYTDRNTRDLFIHLLLTVNYEDVCWKGITIKRGQRVVSYEILSKELGLSVREIRTSLNHLKSTSEVTHQTTSQYSVITVSKYSDYQSVAGEATNDRQATDNNERNKEEKNKRIKEYTGVIGGDNSPQHTSKFTPPILEEIQAYCKERKNDVDAQRFIDFYTAKGWMVGKNKMKDWKAAVRTWETKKPKRKVMDFGD